MKKLVFDIETNALSDDPSTINLDEIHTIHTIGIYDFDTDKVISYDTDRVPEGLAVLARAECIIGHNIIHFDIPVINKLYPEVKITNTVVDTLVYARLVYPDIFEVDLSLYKKDLIPAKLMGNHTLEAWGYRLGVLKGKFREEGDFNKWTPEMSEYCRQDVTVNVALYNKLESKGYSREAIEIEHETAKIIKRQIWNGFPMDIPRAEKLHIELVEKRSQIEKELKKVFPLRYIRDGRDFTPKKDDAKKGYKEGCPITKIKLIEFNPSSRHHILYWLKRKYGWVPTEVTDKGEPSLDDEIIRALPYQEAPLLAEYLLLDKRIGQLAEGKQAWFKMLKKDNKIHGYVNSNGAVTGRMTHSKPNMAQVPAVDVPYGEECRSLFGPRSGWVQVGIDASGIEARNLAHYMSKFDGGKYAKIILEGDLHTENQRAAGLATRSLAKRFFYAFLYGAGDEKIGSIIGKNSHAGRKLKNEFLAKTKGLKELLQRIGTVVKTKGFLVGLDGRRLKIRSAHSALNTLLQSAGAIVMKKALIILDAELQAKGYVPGFHYEFLANIHDEWQIECWPAIAHDIGKTGVEAITKAGDHFNFRCRLDGEYKVGTNWAETH